MYVCVYTCIEKTDRHRYITSSEGSYKSVYDFDFFSSSFTKLMMVMMYEIVVYTKKIEMIIGIVGWDIWMRDCDKSLFDFRKKFSRVRKSYDMTPMK